MNQSRAADSAAGAEPRCALRHIALTVAALLGQCAVGHAATILNNVPDSMYTALAAQPQYAASGYVTVNLGGGSFIIGSGTLVAPNWVLTAGHVVTADTAGTPAYSPSQITFGQGPSIPGNLTGADSVAQVVVMPGWSFNLDAGNDLALIRLTNPVTNVTPATLYPASLGTEVGQVGTAVGYGTTGTGLTGNTNPGGAFTMRGIENTIDALGGATTSGPTPPSGVGTTLYSFAGISSNLMLTDFDRPGVPSASIMGNSAPLPLEGASTPGDSGGGMFITVGGKTYLAGVADFVGSFPNNALSTSNTLFGFYGDFDGYTRVSAPSTSQFLDSILGVPEPSAGLLASLGSLALLVVARRRRQG